MAGVVLGVGAVAAVGFGVLDRAPDVSPVEPDAGVTPERASPSGTTSPVPVGLPPSTPARARFDVEAIGDGSEVPAGSERAPQRDLRVVREVAEDGTTSGTRLRDVLIGIDGLGLRYRTAAVREVFLAARFRVPPPAFLPAEDPPGAPIREFVDVIRQAGFEVEYRPPLVVVGEWRDPSRPPPPPAPPPPQDPPPPQAPAPDQPPNGGSADGPR